MSVNDSDIPQCKADQGSLEVIDRSRGACYNAWWIEVAWMRLGPPGTVPSDHKRRPPRKPPDPKRKPPKEPPEPERKPPRKPPPDPRREPPEEPPDPKRVPPGVPPDPDRIPPQESMYSDL
jgi:hypothetical protein